MIGVEEGQVCGRSITVSDVTYLSLRGYRITKTIPRQTTCTGHLELRPPKDSQGCRCWISPPCNHCLSTVPECPNCGWREEEPS